MNAFRKYKLALASIFTMLLVSFRKYKAPVASAIAVLLVMFNVLVASAHHDTYSSWRNCKGEWGANAYYVGGDQKRLVLISMVEVNGVLYEPDDPNWSQAPAGYTGGVVTRQEYLANGGSEAGLPTATNEDYIWVGVSNGWKIFDRSGTEFKPNPDNWEGVIKMYKWESGKWKLEDTDYVTEPASPDDCPNPKVVVKNECSEEGIVVWLKNPDGDSKAKYYVKFNDGDWASYEVSPNAEKKLTFPVGEDENYSIRVKEEKTGFDQTYTGTRDCVPPPPVVEVKVKNECVNNGVLVILKNPGGGSNAVYHVQLDGGTSVQYVVAPNGEQTVTLTVAEDANYSIRVTEDVTGFDQTYTGTRDCVPPPPIVEVKVKNECVNNGVLVILRNPNGGSDAVYHVQLDGGASTQYVVAPNGEQTVTLVVAEDAAYSIRVTEDVTGFDQTYTGTRDCVPPPPKVSVELVNICSNDGVLVILRNPNGGSNAVYTVQLDNGTPVQYVVAPNGETTVSLTVAEDANYVVRVTEQVTGFDESYPNKRDCEPPPPPPAEPGATVQQECTPNGYQLILTNPGGSSFEFTVKFGNEAPLVYNLAANAEPLYVPIPISEGQTMVIVVTGDGFNKTFTVEKNCEGVNFDLVYDCADGGFATAVFTNTSAISKDFVFVSNTVSETVVTVGPGLVETRPVPINEDQVVTATVTVASDNFVKEVSVERDCAANPSVMVVAECKVDEKQFRVYLHNTGGADVTFTVMYINETNEHFVSANNVFILALPLPERTDQSFPLKITAPGMEPFETTISGCGQPTNLPPGEQPQQFGVTILIPFAARQE